MFIINKVPELKRKVHPVKLISEATPVHDLTKAGVIYGCRNLLIKREDLTCNTYGGNKVRNLEFLLGDALHRKHREVMTLIPYGSNFTGAFAAQSKKLGLGAELSQFVVTSNPQIEAHVRFGLKQGARMKTFRGTSGLPLAAAYANYRRLQAYYVPPGASNILGALGHANAFLEMIEQQNHSAPDRVIVGAGTCGTISGLMVGKIVAGVNTKITGVRCAEPIVCNKRRIASLVNATLKFLSVSRRVTQKEIELFDSPGNKSYALPSADAGHLIEEFFGLEGILLDTTYTSKVMIYLKDALARGQFRSERLMYWHTFSPAALEGV